MVHGIGAMRGSAESRATQKKRARAWAVEVGGEGMLLGLPRLCWSSSAAARRAPRS